MPPEIKFSLRTTDWEEAVLRCQEENLKLERTWRSNLVGQVPTVLSHRQIAGLAGEFYTEMVAHHRDEPGSAFEWEQSLAQHRRRSRAPIGPLGQHLYMAFSSEAQAFLRKRDIHLVGERLESFLRAYVEAKEMATTTLIANAKRDYTPDTAITDRFPKFDPPPSHALKFDVLWADFDEAKGLAASTKKKWLPYFRQLIKRIGTDDMSKVTEQHLLDWRDELLATKVSQHSVRYGQIAAARAFFRWCKVMKKLPTNPAAEVVVEIGDKKGMEMRGFDDNEAVTILTAASGTMSSTVTDENVAARRWVPWLCAYTGARVNELTQLRACDVVEIDGIPCLKIVPEAGTVKTSRPRTIPIHPHLIEMDFVVWAHRNGQGKAPLFYSIARQRNVARKNPTYTSVGNKLAHWVRKSLGITDPTVAPNHGWRYRFKEVGIEVGMKERVLDAIQGHAPRTDGEKYGRRILPRVMLPEILKYPRYECASPLGPAFRRGRSPKRKTSRTK